MAARVSAAVSDERPAEEYDRLRQYVRRGIMTAAQARESLALPASVPDPQGLTGRSCRYCRAALENGKPRCGYCGAPVPAESVTSSPAPRLMVTARGAVSIFVPERAEPIAWREG